MKKKNKSKKKEPITLQIKLKGKNKLWVEKLVKRLNNSYTLINGILMILAWSVLLFLLAILLCLWRNSYFMLDSSTGIINGPLSFSRNVTCDPSCEFQHPLTGECTVWEKLDNVETRFIASEEDSDNELINTIALADQRVFTVMVENHPEARPQSGLASAKVVYEVLVEGGITRFMAIFDNLQDLDTVIGPVRSARPYYLWFAYELDNALYGHVGGSPDALNYIQNNGLNDCDEFYYGGTFYERISSRRAPHNTYTTIGDLQGCNDGAAMGRLAEIDPWTFMSGGEDKVISSPEFSEINIAYSDYTYLAKWQYNQEDRLYYRFYADAQPNVDKGNNQQIATSNIVVLEMPSRAIDDYGRLSMDSIGDGDLIIYRKGEKMEGTWLKEDKASRIQFLDENGENIELMPGRVWISIVPSLEIVDEK